MQQTQAGATVRSIRKIEVIEEGDGKYRLDFYLDGALYRMVRKLVGAFLASMLLCVANCC
jgi:tRNA U38,U39,U40 pseudouridine synthase TruA